MIEFEVAIPRDGATIPAFFCKPAAEGRFPCVIMYMDAPGIREELRDFARRIAGHGYAVLLPDLYWKLGRLRFDVPNRDDAMLRVMLTAMNTIDNASVAADTRAFVDWMAGRDDLAHGRSAAIGWCMSGQYVLGTVGRHPGEFVAGATLYGVGMATDKPDSPHLLAGNVKAELYCAFAETDHTVPATVVPTLCSSFDAAKVRYEIETFPGTVHGFQFPRRRGDYHADAAEAAWTKIFALFARKLGGTA
ncbi:MAG: dienelactone hydrolase family protein [Alphaproteobacteria bacterium]